MACVAVIHMTQQLRHMAQRLALEIWLLQSHGALEGKQGFAACRFYTVKGRRACAGLFALKREGSSKE
jgi:hypothetical protein